MNKITGFANFSKDISNEKEILYSMSQNTNTTTNDAFYFYNQNLSMYSTNDFSSVFHFNGNTYCLILNGIIYNIDDLKKELKNSSFDISEDSDIEILLKAFVCFGYDLVNKLNGIFSFAIWDENKKELFIARDHFGIKPLYYSLIDDNFIFSSDVKSIFKHPSISPHIEKEGICELFGIGPAHTPGSTIFHNVDELKPAHFLVYNKNGLYIKQYWKLRSKPHTDSLGATCENIRFLLEDAIKLQIKTDKTLCTFLSGGLDSSIITMYALNILEENGKESLKTFSVDYLDNDKNFVKTEFQPNSDNFFIDIMKQNFNLSDKSHSKIVIDTPELANSLKDAMLARNFPGMADVDSSLLLFCKEVSPYAKVSLTGECSDEIFGGYPWFFKEDVLNTNTFPWSSALTERQQILNPLMREKIDLKDYVDTMYFESLNEVDISDSDSLQTIEKKKITHLTLNWFMQTLIDRSERMANFNDFEIRVPFCDYRLVEYAWNIPWEMKSLKGREKGLLRYAMKDLLPSEIIDRKKSPYPKTHNPTYLAVVKNMLSKILNNKNAPLNYLINRDFVLEIINSNGSSFTKPWFGQLMTGPQLMAYLIQINMWMEEFKPTIDF